MKSLDLPNRPSRYGSSRLQALGATVQSASCNTSSLCFSHLNVPCAELSRSRGVVKFVDPSRSCLGIRSRGQIAAATTQFFECVRTRLLTRLDHASGCVPAGRSLSLPAKTQFIHRLKPNVYPCPTEENARELSLTGPLERRASLGIACGLSSLTRSRWPLAAAVIQSCSKCIAVPWRCLFQLLNRWSSTFGYVWSMRPFAHW